MPNPQRHTWSKSIFDDDIGQAPRDVWSPEPIVSGNLISMSWLDDDGSVNRDQIQSTDVPLLENHVQAIVRGALISTADGPEAIEDLHPGDWVLSDVGDPRQIMWIGSVVIEPSETTDWPLTRVMAHSIGPDHPYPDLLLGKAARVYRSGPQFQTPEGTQGVLVPAASAYSADQAIPIRPIGEVEIFHMLLDQHAVFRANGLPLESYHPGPIAQFGNDAKALLKFLQCFPTLQSYQDFGALAVPRQTRG